MLQNIKKTQKIFNKSKKQEIEYKTRNSLV